MEMAWCEVYGYSAVHKVLPHDILDESGTPISSWRFAVANPDGILPPADKGAPWYAAENRGARTAPYNVYCFDDLGGRTEDCETKVLAVAGPDTALDPSHAQSLEELPNDLIVLVESWATGLHWMQPGDWDIRRKDFASTNGPDGAGRFVAFADGAIWFIRSDAPSEALINFCTVEGATSHERQELLGEFSKEYRTPSLPFDRTSDETVEQGQVLYARENRKGRTKG